MSVRLAVERVPADFKLGTDLALGPWCFQGVEDDFPGWEAESFHQPFAAQADGFVASELARATAYQLIDLLAPELNERHGLAYPRRFWHTMLMPWLSHLAMASWRLWKTMEGVVDQYGDQNITMLSVDTTLPLTILSTDDFLKQMFFGGGFRERLMHLVAQQLAPPHWHKTLEHARVSDRVSEAEPRSFRWDSIDYVEGLGWKRRLWSAYSRFVVRRKPLRPDPCPPNIAPPQSFFDFLTSVAHLYLPNDLGDGFPALLALVSRIDFSSPRHLGALQIFYETENLATALAREAGQRVVGVQHGGGYGWSGYHAMIADLEYYLDGFITWGWTEQEHYQGAFKPLPSPKLSRGIGRHKDRNGDLVMVGALMAGFNPRIDFYPVPMGYRRRKEEFISALATEPQSRLRYRPYNQKGSFQDGDWLKKRIPELQIVEGPLDQALFNCRLVVLDHPSTTMAVALAANIPTVCYWSPDEWHLARQAKPLFDDLRKAGILFDDAAQAARHVSAIWLDVPEWWRSERVQAARLAWCHRYARASRWWWWHWLKSLPRL